MTDHQKQSTPRRSGMLKRWLSGSVMQGHEEELIKFIIFIVFLGLIYIANNYWGIHTLRKINTLKAQKKELEYELTAARSAWSDSTKQSRLIRRAFALGLVEAPEPPIKITATDEDLRKLRKMKKK